MTMRTPLGRVRGLGAAGSGTEHFWRQRVTAIALVPLSIWLITSLIGLIGADHGVVTTWIASPVVTAALILFLAVGIYHLKLGIDTVIEDYIPVPWQKVTFSLINIFVCWLIGLAAVLAVLKISLGS